MVIVHVESYGERDVTMNWCLIGLQTASERRELDQKSRHGLRDELVHDGQSIWNSCGQAPVAATVPIWTGLTSPDTQMAGAHTRIFRFVFLLPYMCAKKIFSAAETCWSSRGSDETSNFFSQWFCHPSITQSKNCILSATPVRRKDAIVDLDQDKLITQF
jgi:hypothetical protein